MPVCRQRAGVAYTASGWRPCRRRTVAGCRRRNGNGSQQRADGGPAFHAMWAGRPVERGRKGESFSRAPRHLGGPPSPKITENGVPDRFFLNKICIKSIFGRPDPAGGLGELIRRSPEPLIGWWGDTSPHVSSRVSISRHTEWVGGWQIGPRDNVFPRAPLWLSTCLQSYAYGVCDGWQIHQVGNWIMKPEFNSVSFHEDNATGPQVSANIRRSSNARAVKPDYIPRCNRGKTGLYLGFG